MPFLKGQSGNPGGRPKALLPDGRTLSEVAREYTSEAVATLADVMGDAAAPPAARIAAASTLLDRGWGRASQDVLIGPAARPEIVDPMEARAVVANFLEKFRLSLSESPPVGIAAPSATDGGTAKGYGHV